MWTLNRIIFWCCLVLVNSLALITGEYATEQPKFETIEPKGFRVSIPADATDGPIIPSAKPTESCRRSKTTVLGRHVCEGELIFEDHFDFDVFNSSIWMNEVRIPLDKDDGDFVIFDDRSENCYIKSGVLYIEAMPLENVPGYDSSKIRRGTIDLGTRCTGTVDVEGECKRTAKRSRILPPVMSGRLNTKKSFTFRYGQIEIKAKLPKGDWLFPLITLDPAENYYGVTGYASGQMRVAFIRGNEDLRTPDGQTINGSKLMGGVVLKPEAIDREKWMQTVSGSEHWGNKFHTYSMTWSETSIKFAIDGKKYGELNGGFTNATGARIAPFDKEFYITLGVSAGGISDFPDFSTLKPWNNTDPKNELCFSKNIATWYPTWKKNNARLAVDYVQVWAL